MTLTTRLSLFFSLMLAVVLVGFSVGIYLLADRYLHHQAAERLDTVLNSLSGAIEGGPSGVEWEPANRHVNLDFALHGDPVVWTVANEKGELLDRSKGSNTDGFFANPSVAALLKNSTDENIQQVVDSWEIGRRWFHPESHLPNHDGAAHFGAPDHGSLHAALSVTAAVSLTPVHGTLRQLAMSLIALSAGIWLVAFIGGRFVCRQALLPVNRMAVAAGDIGPHDLSQRLPQVTTADELGDLNRKFNTLLDRLQVGFEQQQRFTADASHQLRTPLTVILGRIEVALRRERSPEEYREVLVAAQRKASHLAKMVEALLFLARTDSEAQTPRPEPLDLMIWLPQYLPAWGEHARSKDIMLEFAGPGPFAISAHPTLLAELVNILLDNACKYSDAGTPIQIRIERIDDAVCLKVEDRGCGIADSDMPSLFAPFFRSAETRHLGIEGTGLGLSIARRLAAAIGGTLTATSQHGLGSCFMLRLPASTLAPANDCLHEAARSAQSQTLSIG
ncbi:MAG: arlS [Schlesneria sp.]|nr:arlS [Schlesneria sp.]